MDGRRRHPGFLALSVLAATGLAVDAVVHLHLAASYGLVRSGIASEATLFRAEGVVAALAALAVLVRPSRATALMALLVAGAGVAAVLVHTYVDVGPVGPFPDMYEPVWYPEKTLSCIAEAAATVAAAVLFLRGWRAHRRAALAR